MQRAFTEQEKMEHAATLAMLRAEWPLGHLVTLRYDNEQPQPIQDHRMTRYNGPQVKLEGRWWYLSVIAGGRDLRERIEARIQEQRDRESSLLVKPQPKAVIIEGWNV